MPTAVAHVDVDRSSDVCSDATNGPSRPCTCAATAGPISRHRSTFRSSRAANACARILRPSRHACQWAASRSGPGCALAVDGRQKRQRGRPWLARAAVGDVARSQLQNVFRREDARRGGCRQFADALLPEPRPGRFPRSATRPSGPVAGHQSDTAQARIVPTLGHRSGVPPNDQPAMRCTSASISACSSTKPADRAAIEPRPQAACQSVRVAVEVERDFQLAAIRLSSTRKGPAIRLDCRERHRSSSAACSVRVGQHGQPAVVMIAPRGGGIADVATRAADRIAEELDVALGQVVQGFSVRAESGSKRASHSAAAGWPSVLGCRGLFQHHVGVAAAEAERADAGQPRMLARRARAPSFAALCSGSAANGMSGLGVWKCRLGGNWRCLSTRAAFIRLAMPEAASRWPMLVLTAPRTQRLPAGRPSRRTLPRAVASIVSPSRVPVPWVSTNCDLARRYLGPGVGLAEHLLLGGAAGGGQIRCSIRFD